MKIWAKISETTLLSCVLVISVAAVQRCCREGRTDFFCDLVPKPKDVMIASEVCTVYYSLVSTAFLIPIM
jgi:hypothetical protein